MIGDDEDIGVRSTPGLVEPLHQASELPVGLEQRDVRLGAAGGVGVLGLVGLGEPEERYGGPPVLYRVARQDIHRPGHPARVGLRLPGPRSEPLDDLVVERPGQAEVGMDGRPAGPLGVRVMDVGVAGRAAHDGHVLPTMLRDDVGKCGNEQHAAQGRLYLGEYRLKGRKGPFRVEVPEDDRVGREAVHSWVAPGRHRRGVRACDGWEDGVVVGEGHPLRGEGGQVRHELCGHLRGLQPIEDHDENRTHRHFSERG